MEKKYILAVDLGTTSVRTLALDVETNTFDYIAQEKIKQFYPEPNFVEQDAKEIVDKVKMCLEKTIKNIPESEIVGMGITNQRETVVMWDKKTAKPFYNAIVWQCRRTFAECQKLRGDEKMSNLIRQKTGLYPDSYFSATKIKWLFDNVSAIRDADKNDNLCVGTLDSYLIYVLTGGQNFVTDHTNASRTLLYNLSTNNWDDDLLNLFKINKKWLPKIINCDEIIGEMIFFDKKIKIGGILGDQQASLLGQCCVGCGDKKITFGTGAFFMENIGEKPILIDNLITTLAWKTKNQTCFAFEGNMYTAGACLNWLQDKLEILPSASKLDEVLGSTKINPETMFIPALSGLGAPFWLGSMKASFCGMTLATTKNDLIRAVCEGICFNARAVVDRASIGVKNQNLPIKVDGGMTKSAEFVQLLSDSVNGEIVVSGESESTSLGACYMCGLAFGVYKNFEDFSNKYKKNKIICPKKLNLLEIKFKNWQNLIKKFI